MSPESEAVMLAYLPLCRTIGQSFARAYEGEVEADDVEQECALALVEGWDRWAAADVSPAAFPGYVKLTLERKAVHYCRRERAEKFHRTMQYGYRPGDVRKALPSFLAGLEVRRGAPRKPAPGDDPAFADPVLYPPLTGGEDAWQSRVELPSDYDDEEPSNDLTFMADISRVWDGLSGYEQASLRMYVDFLNVPNALGALQRKAVQRANDHLTELMNEDGVTRDRIWPAHTTTT